MGSPASEAALLADMAQLKLEQVSMLHWAATPWGHSHAPRSTRACPSRLQGDLQGANELFKTALEARKQLEAGSHSDAGGGSDGGGEAEADSWEGARGACPVLALRTPWLFNCCT